MTVITRCISVGVEYKILKLYQSVVKVAEPLYIMSSVKGVEFPCFYQWSKSLLLLTYGTGTSRRRQLANITSLTAVSENMPYACNNQCISNILKLRPSQRLDVSNAKLFCKQKRMYENKYTNNNVQVGDFTQILKSTTEPNISQDASQRVTELRFTKWSVKEYPTNQQRQESDVP